MESKQVYPIGWLKIIYQGSFFSQWKETTLCHTNSVTNTMGKSSKI
jgi:hypothetical protein